MINSLSEIVILAAGRATRLLSSLKNGYKVARKKKGRISLAAQ